MTLLSSKLATELQAMVPVDNENDAINNFATAWENYFYDSSVAGITPLPGVLSASTNAMKAALVGMSTSGSTAVQSGIIAFWNTIIASIATIWVTVPVIISGTPPPSLSGISSALDAVFASNTSSELSLEDSTLAIANALHPLQLGGIAILGPPPPGGTPTPIL